MRTGEDIKFRENPPPSRFLFPDEGVYSGKFMSPVKDWRLFRRKKGLGGEGFESNFCGTHRKLAEALQLVAPSGYYGDHGPCLLIATELMASVASSSQLNG